MIVVTQRLWHGLHPLNAMLLAFPLALFTGALCTDLAYIQSMQIMWSNFSSWLIAGGLFVGGFATLWALVDAIRFRHVDARPGYLVHFILLAAAWVAALFSALVHAHDAWASVMPTGLLFSIVVEVLILAAAWTGYARRGVGEILS